MNSAISTEVWTFRAAACELLALSLRHPTSELAKAVASGEWADAAEEIVSGLGLAPSTGFSSDARAMVATLFAVGESGRDVDPDDLGIVFHSLRAEATRLFVGAPEPVCSPYEGVWRAADDGVQPLLFVNPHSLAVERFCLKCGLGRAGGANDPLDAVATELELLQHLASLEAGFVLSGADAPAYGDFPGGSPAAAYDSFLNDHVLVWMPCFAQAVAENARLPFYRAVANLLASFLADAG